MDGGAKMKEQFEAFHTRVDDVSIQLI